MTLVPTEKEQRRYENYHDFLKKLAATFSALGNNLDDNTWSVKIEKVTNGYKVSFSGENYSQVYEEKDEQDGTNRDHIIEMLYDILEHFAELGSKYDKRRVYICYKKGSGYEGKESPQKGVEFDAIDRKEIVVVSNCPKCRSNGLISPINTIDGEILGCNKCYTWFAFLDGELKEIKNNKGDTL